MVTQLRRRPVEITYPGLLDDLPAPSLRAYPRETVFAEKLEAIAQLGIANSRMKNYFDLLAHWRAKARWTRTTFHVLLQRLSSVVKPRFRNRYPLD